MRALWPLRAAGPWRLSITMIRRGGCSSGGQRQRGVLTGACGAVEQEAPEALPQAQQQPVSERAGAEAASTPRRPGVLRRLLRAVKRAVGAVDREVGSAGVMGLAVAVGGCAAVLLPVVKLWRASMGSKR